MKTSYILAAIILQAFNVHAQGTVNFQNSVNTRVYGYTSTGMVPLGSQFYAGLYYASDGTTDESQFIMLGSATRFVDGPTGPTGLFVGGTRTAPTAVPGGFGMFEVRAWNAAYGNSYETAMAGGDACIGRSNILRVDTSDPTTVPPGTPASLTAFGLISFTVANLGGVECPEPSTWALGALGFLLLYALRKQKEPNLGPQRHMRSCGVQKLTIIAITVFAALTGHAQGTVSFANATGTTAQRVRIDDPITGALAPAGQQYNFGLYWAPDGTLDETAFVMVGSSVGVAGTTGINSGIYNGGTRTIPVSTPGDFAMFQVRGWETAYGATYETALAVGQASGQGRFGKSNIVRVDTGDPTAFPPEGPGSLTSSGINGFALTVVPEPSAITFAFLTASIVFLVRRPRSASEAKRYVLN